jgi:hypothetical protein
MVAVQGSRRDTYPSGMARDMGGGMRIYVLRPGLRSPGPDESKDGAIALCGLTGRLVSFRSEIKGDESRRL